jgi:hypothetical protein
MPLTPSTPEPAYGSTPPGDFKGAVSPPDLSKNQKPGNRAIRDAIQAKNIIMTLLAASRERNIKNARIQAKVNSEKPHRTDSLENEGLAWKANFSTKVLAMLVEKVAPRFVQAVEATKYITNSSLPEDIEGAAEKTEAFRREITSTARNRPGWRDFLGDLAQENALFGFAAVAHLDEFSWFPKFFRQDFMAIPTGTKPTPGKAQVVGLKEVFLLHELFDLIRDKESAIARGWNIENAVMMLNASMPQDRRSQYSAWERVYEDLIRESNLGLSHESGARVVVVWHLLATEIDGKVSHYIFEEKTFTELFTSEDQYESMWDAAHFFTFQQGNGTIHGSKGIGRELYSIAGIIDRSRNEVVDRLNLSGKVIIQADEKVLKRFRMSVVGNAILIAQGYSVSERKLDAAVEPFIQLDQFLTNLLDQMAGATTPKALEGERVTKAAVDFLASREEETKDNIISRFLTQFSAMVTPMQKRMCDPNTSEDDAKAMQDRLLKIMSREELDMLANMPSAETVKDYTEIERQQIVIIAQEARGNPLYNGKEMERRKLTALIDEEFADAVLLPDNDPTEQAEQARQQMLELASIIIPQNADVPVSPRDGHLIHLGVLMPALETTAQHVVQDPHALPTLMAILKHAKMHEQAGLQVGVSKQDMAPFTDIINKLAAEMPKLAEAAQQQAAAEQRHAELQAGAPPGPLDENGQPIPGVSPAAPEPAPEAAPAPEPAPPEAAPAPAI